MTTAAEIELLLARQRQEVAALEAKLQEVRNPKLSQPVGSWQDTAPAARKGSSAEVRILERELGALRSSVSASWLHGPVSSIEHEVARRKHVAKVQHLEAQLIQARHSFVKPLPQPVTTPTFSQPASIPTRSGPPHAREVLAPAEVVAERQRKFGDRLIRVWAEDCASRGGIRIHALDTVSFGRCHVDMLDFEVQAMFDHWCHVLTRRKPSDRPPENHNELQEFLMALLDAVFFDVDDMQPEKLQLRVPANVEPPRPLSQKVLVSVGNPQARPGSADYPISASWIREKILVPRAVVAGRSVRRPSSARQGYGSYAAPTTSSRGSGSRPQSARASFSRARCTSAAAPSIPSTRSRPQSARAASPYLDRPATRVSHWPPELVHQEAVPQQDPERPIPGWSDHQFQPQTLEAALMSRNHHSQQQLDGRGLNLRSIPSFERAEASTHQSVVSRLLPKPTWQRPLRPSSAVQRRSSEEAPSGAGPIPPRVRASESGDEEQAPPRKSASEETADMKDVEDEEVHDAGQDDRAFVNDFIDNLLIEAGSRGRFL